MTRVEKIEAEMEKEFSAVFTLFAKTPLERSTLRTALTTAYLMGVKETFSDPSLGVQFKDERVFS